MRKHTTHETAPATADQGVDFNGLALELDAIATRMNTALGSFSTHWTGDELDAAEEALQGVKGQMVRAIMRFAPPAIAALWQADADQGDALPTGFPLCPILQRGTLQADLSNAWRLTDQAIDRLHGGWDADEMRNCAVLLFGAVALIEAAEEKAFDQEQAAHLAAQLGSTEDPPTTPPAPALSDRARAEERDRQAHASRLADFASGRAESDRLARAAALELMKQARPAPVPSLQGREFQRLAVELEQASSLLTDAACAMSGGWTVKELERCDAMVSGAKALIDQGRARLERADADYVRALQPDQRNDEAGEEAQP